MTSRGPLTSFKILLAEPHLLHMPIKRTWAWN